jgi:integrase
MGTSQGAEVAHVRRLISHVQSTRNPYRNHVMVLLSFKAGLPAGEIAGLNWRMLLRPDGRLAKQLNIDHRIAKKGSGRCIPISPDLRVALERLRRHHAYPKAGAVVLSERGTHMTSRSVVNWFRQMYAEIGMAGCSSHSGRRTFLPLCPPADQDRRIVTRRPGARRPSLPHHHRALHRRRPRRAASPHAPDLIPTT